MITQLHAGFILSSVKKILLDSESDFQIMIADLLEPLCCFEVESNISKNFIDDPIVSVLNNIISRGLPTFPSIEIEDKISSLLTIAEKTCDEKLGDIKFKVLPPLSELKDLIYRAFFIVEPRIKKHFIPKVNFQSWESHPASEFEVKFFQEWLPNNFHPSVCQIIEPQREIQNILKFSPDQENSLLAILGDQKDLFYDQRVDFCFDFPFSNKFKHGLVIEIDGKQHDIGSQKRLDQQRDKAINNIGWSQTVRFPAKSISFICQKQKDQIQAFLNHPYAKMVKGNYDQPIFESKQGVIALQAALSPIGIARVQKTILYLIKCGLLKLNSESWKIAVIERDVPCGYLAINDLINAFTNLFQLEGKNRHLPNIEISVICSPLFDNSIENVKKWSSGQLIIPEDFDVILDVSILQRTGFDYPDLQISNISTPLIKIRSASSKKTIRSIESSNPIQYKISEVEQPPSLVYFLNNIFRKLDFREGQVNIIRKTLALEGVIALLPTGSGKSLTYQLSVMLQPGLVLIVDPLKSLMRDQDSNLKRIGIDSSVFINSSVKAKPRRYLSELMMKGYFQFVFISPERLQIEEFRSYLQKMKDYYFIYCVVDEAHCVSEWGHDFRPSYLRLGENVQKYCPKRTEILPLIGLTGTASFDVLEDVQRELNIIDPSSVITPSKFEREELRFQVEQVKNNADRGKNNQLSTFKLKQNVSQAKMQRLVEIIKAIPSLKWSDNRSYHDLNSFISREIDYKNCGIVFCPHVTSIFGVTDVKDYIAKELPNFKDLIDIYAGSLDDDDGKFLVTRQNDFKDDKLAMLVATKAFGMGIDKPNIRFTIHFSMPQSIESFYQEAGRAGRDRDISYCYILYSPETVPSSDGDLISIDKDLMMSFFKNSFPGAVKEKKVITELLEEIRFPYLAIDQKISDVADEVEDRIILNPWKKDGKYRLYINDDYSKTYGYIDLVSLRGFPESRPQKMVFDPHQASKLINEIVNLLIEHCPSGIDPHEWFTKIEPQKPRPGLGKIVSNLALNSSEIVNIPFTNDRFQDITSCLQKENHQWSSDIVIKAYSYCYDPEDYVNNLEYNFYKVTNKDIEISQEGATQIKIWFSEVRNEQETYRAVYRLSVIGVIDDYVVDYNAKSISAVLNKKSDDYYIDHLVNYIRRYDTPEYSRNVKQMIYEAEGDTVIHKCCNFLIDFVYRKIASKRKEAINVMENALKSNDFVGEVNTYFDSKFTNEFREKQKNDGFDWIWGFLKVDDFTQDTIRHIKGACDRLLVENPDDPTFLFLRAYSKLTNASGDIEVALEDLRKSLNILREVNNLSWKDLLSIFSKFYQLVVSYDKNLQVYLDKELLSIHIRWLKKFNKIILEEKTNA